MDKLWVRIIRKHRIVEQSVVELNGESARDKLVDICHNLDLAVPIWLNKNENEFDAFQRTSFTKDHFMEAIPFDRMEIEVFDENSGTRRSSDPRNAFDGI